MGKKSLGYFKYSNAYTAERYYGVKQGYMQAYMMNILFDAYNRNVGSLNLVDTSKPDIEGRRTFQHYVKFSIHYMIRQILDKIIESKHKKEKRKTIANLQRQLIALRLIERRFQEENAKYNERNIDN